MFETTRDGELQRLFGRIYDIIKSKNLEIPVPSASNNIPVKMDEYQFRKTLLDLPMMLKPDELSLIINKYRLPRRLVDYKQFVEDLLARDSLQTPAPRQLNPKVKALAEWLQETRTELIPLMTCYDKHSVGRVSVENFCRGLAQYQGIRDLARVIMDLKTKEVDYRKLQNDISALNLDSPTPTDEELLASTPRSVSCLSGRLSGRGIVIDDEFKRNKSGLVDKSEFMKTARTWKLGVNDDELERVADHFTVNGRVDYNRMSRSMRLEFPGSHPEPQHDVDVEECKKRLLDAFVSRKINVWALFKPLDRIGSGLVTKEQFIQAVVNLHLDLKIIEITAVADNLTSGDGTMINYGNFAKSLSAIKSVDLEETIESVLEKLRNFLTSRKIKLGNTLSVFDRERSGLISIPQFVGAVRRIGFDVHEGNLAVIRRKYEDKTSHFLNWIELAQDVDMEKNESRELNSSTPLGGSMRTFATTPSSPALKLYSGTETPRTPRESGPIPETLIPLYPKISRALKDFRFDMNDEFVRRDRFKKGAVPIAVFRQVLALLPLRLRVDEIDAITAFYKDQNTDSVHYASFKKDVDELGNQPAPPKEEPIPEQVEVTVGPEKDEAPQDITPIMRRMKNSDIQTGANLIESFRPFDRFKNGSIHIAKVSSAINSTGLVLTDAEIKLICETYKDARRPEFFNYQRFCLAVNNIPEDVSCGFGTVPITADEEVKVSHLVRRLSQTLKQKRWSFSRVFSGCQSSVMDPVTFSEKVKGTGVYVRTDEWSLIMKKYKANSNGDIDWKKFVNDTEDRSPF